MKNSTRVFFSFLVICFLIFVLDRNGGLYGVRNLAEGGIVPIQNGVNGIKTGLENNFRILTFWKSGEARIKDLERRNLEIVATCASIGQLKEENTALRGQLEVALPKTGKPILAKTIGNDGFLILDRGANDGVETQDVVVLGNYLVGTVARVTPRRSWVILPTNKQSKILVKIGQIRGEVSGQFGTAIILDGVNQNESLAEGEYILTSGEGMVTMPNLIIGKVGKLKSRESDIFKTAKIIPFLEFSKLEQVFVWK